MTKCNSEITGETTSWQQLGKSQLRIEDASLLTGNGRYADDLATPKGCHHLAFLRSPYAHARILSVSSKDENVIFISGQDAVKESKPFIVGVKEPALQYSLATDKVRYFGEPVAAVIARDRYLAEDALDGIEVEYDELPVVIHPEKSATSENLLHEDVGSNIVHDRHFSYGEPTLAFANADKVVDIQVKYPRNSCTPIECFHVTASYDPAEDSYEVTANFQGPFTLHPVMARALNVPGNRLRLKTPRDSGGSYGVKQAIFPYIVAVCLAAKKSGTPVRWVEDRAEHLAAATAATNRIIHLKAAVNNEGRITALEYDQLEDCGAYLRAPEPATLYRMHGNMTGAYDIQNLAIRNRVVLTNKTPTGLVRGFGGPQVYFALERLMDKIATTLGVDKIDLRKRNMVSTQQMPYTTASGGLLDSGDYQLCVDRATTEGGLDTLLRRRDEVRAAGGCYGIGVAAVIEPSISNMGYIATLLSAQEREKSGPKNGALATVTVNFDPVGSITVNTASVPSGQGHRTVLAQVVAEVFSVPLDAIVVTTDHDTGKDAWSIASGNYSSRFAGAVAGAAFEAANKLRQRLAAIAAQQLNDNPDNLSFSDGRIISKSDPQVGISITRTAASAHWSPLCMPDDASLGLRETAFCSMKQLTEADSEDRINSSGAYGFIFDFCGIEIDSVSGAIRIDKYVTMHDAGRLLNPMLVDGQIRGGFAQGLGAALLEEFVYSDSGAFMNGTLAEYLMPTSCDVPDLTILHHETPSPFTQLGAKGVGEGNCMSTPVCLANAVADALGVEDISLPLTKGKVAELIMPAEPENPNKNTPASGTASENGHAVTGGGKSLVPQAPEQVWALILDPDKLASLIPGCESFEVVGEYQYKAKLLLGVGPIKGMFDAKIALTNIVEYKSLTITGSAVGKLGQSAGEGNIVLKPIVNGTEVEYQYSMVISGKAASIGGRLLDGATRSLINVFFDKLVSEGSSGFGQWFEKIWQSMKRLFGGGE